MKTVIALRHVHFEDLGIFEPLLKERGYTIRYIDATIDDLTAVDAAAPELMVVLGGPIGAFDDGFHPFLKHELVLVRQRLDSGRPLLGICLGAQLMARALGAKVYPLGVKEIGFAPLDLTERGRQSPLALLGDIPVLHWHGDQFDIPAGAAHLASTPVGPNQAFGIGDAVLGLQFHLEADTARIEQWLVGHACELARAGVSRNMLRQQAREIGPRLEAVARQILEAWLDKAIPS